MVTFRPVALVAILSCLAALAAAGDDAGLDWQPVAAADSKLRLTLPETANLAQYFRAQLADYSATLFIARVPARAYRGDQVAVVYVELSPGRFFPDKSDASRVLAFKGLTDADLGGSPSRWRRKRLPRAGDRRRLP